MSARLRAARLLAAPEEWTTRRLRILAALACVVVLALLVGAAVTVRGILGEPDQGGTARGPASPTRPGRSGSPSDAGLGAAARPGQLSTAQGGRILLPTPSTLGAAQVATGFPRTLPGALAQLAAIDRRALESGSLVTAQDVVTAWAMPGGPTAQTWSVVKAVSILLDAAGLPANGDPSLQITLTPTMGLTRPWGGHVSTDAALACVDFVLTTELRDHDPSRTAAADCQHVCWNSGRWMLAPGREPAGLPSAWPGTRGSYDLGYLWLEVTP